jgi:ABC-type xylose transport system substrate-binding protein
MALVESLKKKGWDRDGRPIAGGGRNTALYGTLQLGTQLGSIGVKMEQLVKETDTIVSEIMKNQRQSIGDSPLRITTKSYSPHAHHLRSI